MAETPTPEATDTDRPSRLGSILARVRAEIDAARADRGEAALAGEYPVEAPAPVDPDPTAQSHVMDYDRVRRFAADDVELERFDCETCRDALYIVDGERPAQNAGRSRSLRPCPSCGSNTHIEPTTYERMGADPLKSWASWDTTLNPRLKPAIDVCAEVVRGTRWIAFLVGGAGIGKTHIANASLIAWCELWKRADAALITVPDLLDQLRQTHAGNAQISLDDLMRYYKLRGFLVLDDLGANRVTDFADEKLYQIIDERMRRKRPTLVTSNVEPGSALESERIEERTLSRLMPGRVVLRAQPDQRELFDK